MADGMEWMLELDSKLEGALAMVRTLTKADASLKGVDDSLRKVEQASGKTAKKMDMSFRGIIGFELVRRAVSGTIDLVGQLASSLAQVGMEALNTAAQNERTTKSFELLFGSTEGRDTLEWIEGIAKFTEFTDDELKGMAGTLAKVGFEGEALTRALAATIDMAAFSGSGTAGANEAVSSLERIKRTGKIDNRSLGGLGIGESAFLAELSRRTGEGTKALKKKLDEGKIDAETSLEALFSMISKKTGKDLGGAGVEMGKTFQARLKHLKDVPDQFFQKLSGSAGFAKISEFTGKLVDALDPDSATGKKIMGGLTNAFDTIGDLLGEIDIGKLVTSISGGMTEIATGIRPALAAFSAIGEVIGTIVRAMGKMFELWERFSPLGIALGKLSDKLAGNQAEKAGLNKSILGERMAGVDPNSARAELKRRGGPLPAIFGPPSPIDPASFQQGQSIGKGLEAGTRDALDMHSPSKVFEDIGAMTGAGFQRGIGKSMDASDTIARGSFAVPAAGGAPARGGATIHVEMPITVHAAGSNGEQIAHQVREQVSGILPGALQSAIEQLAGQAGSA